MRTKNYRQHLARYISWVVDDAGSALDPDTDEWRNFASNPHKTREKLADDSKVRLVGWQCGFEPLVVAVRSYLDVEMGESESCEIAFEYLKEIGWFDCSESREPDFVA